MLDLLALSEGRTRSELVAEGLDLLFAGLSAPCLARVERVRLVMAARGQR
jgi:hypothetical protein